MPCLLVVVIVFLKHIISKFSIIVNFSLKDLVIRIYTANDVPLLLIQRSKQSCKNLPKKFVNLNSESCLFLQCLFVSYFHPSFGERMSG